MTVAFDSSADLAEVRRCMADFRTLIDRLGQRLNGRNSEISGWSPGQHLFHVILATDLGLGNVVSLVRGKGILVQDEGAVAPETEAALTASSIPRGEAQAPRMVQPPDQVDREQLFAELDNVGRSLQAIDESPSSIASLPGWIKHQVLGPMNASHWVRFCRLHAAHHLAIIEEIEAA